MLKIACVNLLRTMALALAASSLAWSQANVDESLETATLYVDANFGSDSNPGTAALPLQTIGAAVTLAVDNNQAGIGTRVIINPGTYRESITVNSNSLDTTLPITLEAALTGTAILSGADIFTGWTPETGNPSIYTTAWPYAWGLCQMDSGTSLEEDIVRRREMIFVNGSPLVQVLAPTSMVENTFYVDETGGIVYIWPPAGTDVNSATIEVATRDSLFSDNGKSNWVLRGLTFQYSNACRGTSAVVVFAGGGNVLFDTDDFVWNNANGLQIDNATDLTVQNSTFNHNGQAGVHTSQNLNTLWQNNETSYNNWRGAQGVYYNNNTAATYFHFEHSQTISGQSVNFNQSYGIHWDTDNQNVTASSIVADSNVLAGLFVETSEGPVAISSSSLCNGGLLGSHYAGGFLLRNSELVSLTSSTVANNTPAEIQVTGQAGGITITNWQTGQTYNLVSQNFTSTSDVIEGGTSQQMFTDGLGGADWTSFQTTLVSNTNTWWNADVTKPFTVPVPNTGTKVDFATWQADTLQDLNSTFAAPSGDPTAACDSVIPDMEDFWLLIEQPSATLGPGGTATFTATIVPLRFTGTVTLTADGLQSVPGTTGTWSPSSISTSGTATFTITTSSNTPAGNYPVTLIANSGSTTHTATICLIVQSARHKQPPRL